MTTETLLRIGELAARAGVSTRTVDFYTSLGLLTPSARTAGNFRLYDAALVDRIAAIRRLEANGVGLEEIAGALRASSTDGMAEAIGKLKQDVAVLQQLARENSDDVSGLVAVVLARANALVGTAVDLAATIHPPV